MAISRGNVQISGLEIVLNNFESLEQQFYNVLSTETKWREVIPLASIDQGINPGATTSSYAVMETQGIGAFKPEKSGEIPTINRNVSKPAPIPILTGLISDQIDYDELRQYDYGMRQMGRSFTSEVPDLLGLAADKHVEQVIFYGEESVDFQPWLDYPGVTATQAADPGGGSEWVNKNGDQMVKDINDAIGKVWSDTRQIHLPETIFIPSFQYQLLASTRMPDINVTALDFVQKKNLFSSLRGTDLTIKPIPYLQGAGAGDTDRMVVSEQNPRNHKLPFPIPFQLYPPVQKDFGIKLIVEYRFGSYHNRYPKSMLYVDEI